jgi:hypothetical protein
MGLPKQAHVTGLCQPFEILSKAISWRKSASISLKGT